MGLFEGISQGVNGAIANLLSYLGNRQTNANNYKMHEEQLRQNYQMFLAANDFTRAEREAAQGYNSAERMAAQAYNTSEREAAQAYNTSEREAAQQFNLDMWKRSNEYNSPAAQAVRLRAAGLNPAALISGAGSTSPVQSSPASINGASISGASTSGGSSATPPYGQPFQETNPLDPTIFGQGFLTMAQAFKVMKEARGLDIDNETRDAKNRATIENLIAEKENLLANKDLSNEERRKIQKEIVGLQIQNMRARFQMRKDIIVEEREREIHNNVLREFEDKHRKAELDYATQELMNRLAVNRDSREGMLALKQLQVMSAEIDKMASEKGFIDAQALTEVTKRHGISLDNLSKAFKVEDEKLDFNRNKWLRKGRNVDKGVRVIDDMAHYFGNVLGIPVKGIFR